MGAMLPHTQPQCCLPGVLRIEVAMALDDDHIRFWFTQNVMEPRRYEEEYTEDFDDHNMHECCAGLPVPTSTGVEASQAILFRLEIAWYHIVTKQYSLYQAALY